MYVWGPGSWSETISRQSLAGASQFSRQVGTLRVTGPPHWTWPCVPAPAPLIQNASPLHDLCWSQSQSQIRSVSLSLIRSKWIHIGSKSSRLAFNNIAGIDKLCINNIFWPCYFHGKLVPNYQRTRYCDYQISIWEIDVLTIAGLFESRCWILLGGGLLLLHACASIMSEDAKPSVSFIHIAQTVLACR